MEVIASAILVSWRRNGAYGLRLIEDLTTEQWLAQPVTGRVMNHPAWIVAHLNVYAPIAAAMLRGLPFEDPYDHRYGQKSRVTGDAGEYPTPAELQQRYRSLHEDAERALADAPGHLFEAPTPLERWRAMHPRIGEMLVTLMVKHESVHLGQLSAWRRALGMPPVSV